MSKRIEDARDPRRIRHSLAELMRTACLLATQCRRDDDATVLRDDPAFRLAASGRAGTTPSAAGRNLTSQPTLSRLVAMLSRGGNPDVLRDELVWLAGWRLRSACRVPRTRPRPGWSSSLKVLDRVESLQDHTMPRSDETRIPRTTTGSATARAPPF